MPLTTSNQSKVNTKRMASYLKWIESLNFKNTQSKIISVNEPILNQRNSFKINYAYYNVLDKAVAQREYFYLSTILELSHPIIIKELNEIIAYEDYDITKVLLDISISTPNKQYVNIAPTLYNTLLKNPDKYPFIAFNFLVYVIGWINNVDNIDVTFN